MLPSDLRNFVRRRYCAVILVLFLCNYVRSSHGSETDHKEDCPQDVYFKCHTSGHCISRAFVCDREVDCGEHDRSDEDEANCKDAPGYHRREACSDHQFTCKDGQCIEKDWVCDKTEDCPDGSDEEAEMCDHHKNSTCDGFLCQNDPQKSCIAKEKVCDSKIDCSDGSDETSCESWITPSPKCTVTRGMFECADSKRCLPLDKVCNGQQDCLDKSDEGGHCESVCDIQCHHTCQHFPNGPECVCEKGYNLTPDGRCVDIDECNSGEEYAYCDQICTNTPGSYKCSCKDGYILQDNTCKAEGEAALLFSTHSDVRLFYLTSHVYDKVASNVNLSSCVSFDGVYVFWATYADGEEAIYRATEIGTEMQMVFTAGLGIVEDLCIDWITKNIYFTDSEKQHIAVCSHDGMKCLTLIYENIDKPRSLVLNSPEGVMYYTDWGLKPRITKVGMDGSQSVDIITDRIGWPNGLAIDHGTNRLYWADAKFETVEYANLDGSNRNIVHNIPVSHPYSIDIFEDTIYWSDLDHPHEIRSCNKLTGKGCKSVIRVPKEQILGIHIYHPVLLGTENESPCTAATCSDLCLLSPKTSRNLDYSCACPDGMELSSNKHSCTKTEKTQYIIVGTGSQIFSIATQLFGKWEVKEMKNHRVPHIGKLVFDSLKEHVIVAHEYSSTISLFDLSTMKVATVFNVNTTEITDMDFDHLGNNLYWVDSTSKTAGLLSLNTYESINLLENFGGEIPIAISLYPEDAIMYIALQREDSTVHIDQFSMDGSLTSRVNRVNDHVIGPVVSLFFDSRSERLFWSDIGSGKIMSVGKEGDAIEVVDLVLVGKKGGDVHELLNYNYSTIYDIVTVGSNVFWTTLHSNEIYWAAQSNPSSVKHMTFGEISSEHPVKIIKGGGAIVDHNLGCHTNNGGCSHACLMVHGKQMCLCPNSMQLDQNGVKCTKKSHCDADEFTCSDGHCLPMHYRCDTKKDCSAGEDEENCKSYTCPLGTFACENGLQCIDQHLVCDSKRDCHDGSDESDEHCGGDKHICSPAEFHCISGECVSLAWKCDNKEDCRDGSDEHDCVSNQCRPDDFRCSSGMCIPRAWECDGAVDCSDMSDEHPKCNVSRSCSAGELKCKNGHCVDKNLVCNGEDDCEDGTDELNCKTSHPVEMEFCKHDEFICHSTNSCIPVSLRCNGVAECPKGEDEKGCEGCGQEEFQCASTKTCIPQKWKCDGVNDCPDHSDEDCPKGRPSLSPSKVECQGMKCKDTGFCIEWKNVCNNVSDCHDGTDEGSACGKSCAKSGCEECHETPIGGHCYCPPGYRLMNDGKKCVDIDECFIPSTCSQYCENKMGSYVCSCKEDLYHLKTDRTSCKAKGMDMEYIFVTNTDVRFRSKSLASVDVAFKSPHKMNVAGLDVDMSTRTIYWSSEVEGILYKTAVGEAEGVHMIRNIARPGKVAYDWVSKNIYFSEKGRLIKVCDFSIKRCATVHETAIDATIDALRVDGVARKLYWSESTSFGQDSKAVIKSADLSGSSVTTVLDKGIHKVTDIVVDDIQNSLYFTDSVTGKVERLVSGPAVTRNVMFNFEGKPSDINLFEGHAYWLNRVKSGGDLGGAVKNNIITKCGVSGVDYLECEYIRLLPEYSSDTVQRFRLSHSALQPAGVKSCERDRPSCSYMCISLASKAVCICEDGIQVRPSQQCPPIVGTASTYKFTSLAEEISSREPKGQSRHSPIWWFFFGLVVMAFMVMVPVTAYYYYQQYMSRKGPIDSVRFENPSYELDNGRGREDFSEGNLSPGEHQYENPITFKPFNDSSGNNNTLKITRGEAMWPLGEPRNPENFTHEPEPNTLV